MLFGCFLEGSLCVCVALSIIRHMFYLAFCFIMIVLYYHFTFPFPCVVRKKNLISKKEFNLSNHNFFWLHLPFIWLLAYVIGYCRVAVSEEMCNEVESLVFDLFANLGATGEQI